jgi:hypothetical protein
MNHPGNPFRWTQAAIVGLAAIASARSVQASCTFPTEYGQLAANCGEGYCYVVSPGSHTSQTLAGTFWSFGSGSPAIGAGNDSGSLPVGAWLHDDGNTLYISGDWQASPGIDGCIAGAIAPGKPAEIMVALISDENGLGDGFFAVASTRRVPGAFPEFDFTFVAAGGTAHDIQLIEIPRARVVSSSRDGANVMLEFGAPTLDQVSPGLYGDGSAGAVELAKGYRIYARSSSPQSNRTSDGWTAVTGILPLGQNVVIAWPSNTEVWYGTTLAFDGGFETAHVGRSVHPMSLPRCEVPPWDDDGDGYAFWPDPTCAPSADVIDCDDGNPNVHPGALEICNGIDDNCDAVVDDVALPDAVGSLLLGKTPGATRLDWSALPVATGYDVVRGDLAALIQSGGSFTAATRTCVADDATETHVDDPDDPAAEHGFWYLLRAGNCAGAGSYDSVDASQVAPRDAGIAASGAACP